MKNFIPLKPFTRTVLSGSAKKMQAIFTIMAFVLGILPSAAQNKTIPVGIPTGGFHINGKPRADSTVGDWIKGINSASGSFVINQSGTLWTPVDHSTTKFIQEPFNGGDMILSGKTDANPNTGWKWSTGKATAKCDIGTGLFHVGIAPNPSDPNQKDTWVFMAGDRLTTNGTSYIDFQFMQGVMKRVGTGTSGTFEYTQADGTPAPHGGRIEGDFVLSMAYSNGGSNANVLLYIWEKTGTNSWGFVKKTIAPNNANIFALTHSTTIDADYVRAGFGPAAGKYNAFQFVEAAVNVSGLLQAADPCLSVVIKSLMIVTKQSDAFNAELADFMEPQMTENLEFGKPEVAPPPAHNCQESELQLELTDGEDLQNQYIKWTSGNQTDLVFKNSTGLIDLEKSKPGTYTFTYDPPSVPGYQCTQASDPITFSIRALPLDVDAEGSTTCSTNGTIRIASPELNTKYSLKLNGSLIGQKTAATNEPLVWSDLASGTYEIIAQKDYTNPVGSCSKTLSDKPIVVINQNPICEITGEGAVVEGTKHTYSVGVAKSYSWSVTGDATIDGSNTGQTVEVKANTTGSGTFTLSVTITADNGCTSTCTKDVTVLDKPEAFTIVGSAYCADDPALGTVTTNASESGVSYQLHDASNDSKVQDPKNGTDGALQWSGVKAGLYYVIATSSDNQETKSNTDEVSANPLPIVYGLTGSEKCAPASGSVTLADSEPGVNYQLQTGAGANVGSPVAGTGDAIVFSDLSAGTYKVLATNATTQCQSTTSTATVTINPLPVVYELTGSEQCAPATGSVTLADSESGVNYQLQTGTGANVGSPVAGTGNAIVFSGLSAGTYKVMATNNSTKCQSTTGTATVTINPLPVIYGLTGTTQCAPATGSVTLSDSESGVNYQLQTGAGANVGSPVAGTGEPIVFSGLSAGSYKILATNATSKCQSTTGTATVEVKAKPTTPTFTIVEPSICGDATGSITITSPIGAGYTYSINNGAYWQSETIFNNVAAGSKPVILAKLGDCISDAANCTPAPEAIVKTQEEAPVVQQTTVKQTTVKADAGTTASTKEVMVKFEEEPEITAYPNPFRETVNFRFVSPVSGTAVLQVLNSAGQVVGTPFRGQVQAQQPMFTTYKSNISAGLLHYRLVVGGKTLNGKVMKQ